MSTRQLILTVFLAMGAVLSSCQEINRHVPRKEATLKADSLLQAAYKARDYERIISIADQERAALHLSPIRTYYWRGYAFSRLRQMRLAEMEWNKAMTQNVNTPEDVEYYAKSANRLAGLLYLKFDYEASIRVIVKAIGTLEKLGKNDTPDYANLLAFLGNCELRLGSHERAKGNYDKAYDIYSKLSFQTSDIQDIVTSVVGLVAINEAHLLEQDYTDAYTWTEKLENLLKLYNEHPNADAAFWDKQQARVYFYRACALEGQGRKAEARKAYEAASMTKYAQTADGQMEASKYLVQAGRWAEAADKLNVLEEQSARYDLRPNLENIQYLMIPKFRANLEAQRRDSALAVASRICIALEDAIFLEKQDAAIELATIYETQQKEAQLALKNAEMTQERFITSILSLSFVLFLAIMIIFFRRQSALRLEKAFMEMETANARAEESAIMKNNFIQQISHEIRTPLNILTGFSQVLTMPDVDLDNESREEIKKQITNNTDRITSLVNKMLELSEAGSRTVIERTQEVSPQQIAAWGIDGSGISISKHVALDLQISPSADNVILLTNKKAAVRVLILVMDNARKFTAPPEGPGSMADEKKQRVSLHIDADDYKVRFVVEDTGIGVPRDKAEVIFQEFVQLNDYYDGVGIGLAVARSLARRLGGDLVLDTSYTAGARFIYTLPR